MKMDEILEKRILEAGLDREEFLTHRRCMRELIPEINQAADILSRAVEAHLMGKRDETCALFRQADMPALRDYVEMLWGGKKKNAEQWRYVRKRTVPNTPGEIPKSQRAKARLPTVADQRIIVARDGYNCVFCGMPVIRREIRAAMHEAYPEARIWGDTNKTQHPAFQCMWLQYDHIFPHAKGGDNLPANVVVACAPCNFGRGDWTLEEVGVIDPRTLPIHKTSWDGLERFLTRR